MQQQRNSDDCPEEIATFAHNRQGDTGSFGESQNLRNLTGAGFVNAHAQRDELERHRNDAIHRFENKGREESRSLLGTDEVKRHIDL
jgi:hypothetical protein